jgi:cytochrome b561
VIRARVLFWLDGILLLAVAVLQSPRMSSLAVHEWLAIAFAVLVGLHLLVNWRWIVKTLRRIVVPDSTRARINAVLNGLLFIIMTITLFSGLAISEVVMPLAGVTTSALRAWRQLHNVLASLGLGVVGFHVALNWDWIAGVVRKGILLRTLPGVTAPLSPDGLATAEAEDA